MLVKFLKSLLLPIIIPLFFFNACGGTTNDLDLSNDEQGAAVDFSQVRIPIKISKVINRTGETKYDQLCHYVHIKAAQMLADSGKYDVVNDELLQQQSIFVEGVTTPPERIVTIEIDKMVEYNGGTFKFAIFSSQSKQVTAEITFSMHDINNVPVYQKKGNGSSTIGSWGVVMQVDRKNMLKGEGYWDFDNSMLGIAVARAINNSLVD